MHGHWLKGVAGWGQGWQVLVKALNMHVIGNMHVMSLSGSSDIASYQSLRSGQMVRGCLGVAVGYPAHTSRVSILQPYRLQQRI